MKIYKIKIAEEFDRQAAGFITGYRIALPTGKTPIGMYLELKKNKSWLGENYRVYAGC